MTLRSDSEGDSIVGTTISGKYRIVTPIAKGGMGRIYRAVQQPLEREVALKILDVAELREVTGRADAGEDFQRRFFLEAASAAQLTHPNTVVIHDYGLAGPDAYFIAMEYLAGRTLAEVIEREAPLAPERVVHVAQQICASLAEAHGRDLVHRDLKPSNVILTQRGDDPDFVKVVDFGLVKRRGEDVTLTQSGALVGTPRYMSPEQISCLPVGPATDVYSLGAVMYHALTGRPPFDSESKFVLMAAHVNVDPPPMREVAPGAHVPEPLEAVVRRCLLKDPAARFPSMADLSEALSSSGFGTSGLSSGTRLADRSLSRGRSGAGGPDPLAATRVDGEGSAERKARARRARRVRVMGGGLLLGGLTLLAVLLLRPRVDPATSARPTLARSPTAGEPDPRPAAPSTPPDRGSPVAASELPSAVPEGPAEGPHVRRVRVETTPPGAWIKHDGTDLGDSPVTLLIPEGERWSIEVGARGYLERTVSITGGQETAIVRLRRRATSGRQVPEAPSEMRVTDNRNPWGSSR